MTGPNAPPNLGTFSGDPRRGPVGTDTAVPDPLHTPKDTGIHGVGGGDPRSGWLHGNQKDAIRQQEEDNIRKAITNSLSDQTVDPKSVPLTGTATREEIGQVTGDARASWLPGDVAHGGHHNWHKKEAVPAPGNIQDPRAGV